VQLATPLLCPNQVARPPPTDPPPLSPPHPTDTRQSTLSQLSIPAADLKPLLQRPAATESDLLAWAASKVAAHPARDAAAPHAARIARLRRALGAAAAWQRPASPLELLLLRVGALVAGARVQAASVAELQAMPEYAVAAAALAARWVFMCV
jgi:hypothetical protein